MLGAQVLGLEIFPLLILLHVLLIGFAQGVRRQNFRIQKIGVGDIIHQLVVRKTLDFRNIGGQFLLILLKFHELCLGIPEILVFHGSGHHGAVIPTPVHGGGQIIVFRNQLLESHHLVIDNVLLFPENVLKALDSRFHQPVFTHFTVLLISFRDCLGNVLNQFGVRPGDNDIHQVRCTEGGYLDHSSQVGSSQIIRHAPFRSQIQFFGYHFQHFGRSQHRILHGDVVVRDIGRCHDILSRTDPHHWPGTLDLKLARRTERRRHQKRHHQGNDQNQHENKKDFFPAVFQNLYIINIAYDRIAILLIWGIHEETVR